MAEENEPKIKVGPINQIALMVSDVQKTAENYWNILGIGPWDIFTLEKPTVFDETYKGKPNYYSYKAGLCQYGDVQIELIQPTTGDSMYSDFIKEHGEGLQHVQYLAGTIEETKEHIKAFEKAGFPLLMDGYFGDGYWAYMDTVDTLKCVWEVVKMPSEISAPHVRVPADENAISPSKIRVKEITQIALVVKDLQQTIESYWNILGIGPWNIREAKPPELHGRTFYGKESDFTAKVGYAKSGSMQIEIIQPTSAENIWNDFMATHGEGMHHLQFRVDDITAVTEIMNAEAIPTIMSGRYAEGGFAYYGTEDSLKCVWECFQPPGKSYPMNRYPEQ